MVSPIPICCFVCTLWKDVICGTVTAFLCACVINLEYVVTGCLGYYNFYWSMHCFEEKIKAIIEKKGGGET